jgi:hypothetical protein
MYLINLTRQYEVEYENDETKMQWQYETKMCYRQI